MSDDTIRTFVAVPLPDAILEELGAFRSRLEEALSGDAVSRMKWVRPGSIHLTLAFLGSIDPARVPEILAALEDAVAAGEPFSIQLAEVGAFPRFGKPSVLWIGLDDDAELLSLQEEVADRLEGIGFPREKRDFVPHLTIARIRRKTKNRLKRRIGEIAQEMEPPRPRRMTVDRVTLYRSELHPDGARYSVLGESPL